MTSDIYTSRNRSPPPPYQSRPPSTHEGSPPPPPNEYGPDSSPATTFDAIGQRQGLHQIPTYENETSDPASGGRSSSKTPVAMMKRAAQSYKDKKRAKEASRKVDFYERLYGFVPKNAMTEAEWRDARERMPKERVPFKARPAGAGILMGGGIGGS